MAGIKNHRGKDRLAPQGLHEDFTSTKQQKRVWLTTCSLYRFTTEGLIHQNIQYSNLRVT